MNLSREDASPRGMEGDLSPAALLTWHTFPMRRLCHRRGAYFRCRSGLQGDSFHATPFLPHSLLHLDTRKGFWGSSPSLSHFIPIPHERDDAAP